MNNNKKIFRMTLGGICLALTVISMYAASVVPGIELTLLAVSSLFTAVMLLETGVGGAFLLYGASLILGIALIPNKLAVLPYGFFFGYYGILKYYIEKIHGALPQLALKLLFFAAAMCAGMLGFKELLIGSVMFTNLPVALIVIAGIVLLMLYDFIFSGLINFYARRIRKKGLDDTKLS